MSGPLSGIRVLDFTWVISGPQCTQVLADFGAEVIRVEWTHHLDSLRYRCQPRDADPTSPDQSGFWNNLNRNKRSITLNMRHPDGVALCLDLVAKCDVVVENFAPGVLASWGLPWEVLSERNPALVYVAMTGFGSDGPNARYVVFAPVMQAVSGLHAMTARPGGQPTGIGFSYADHIGGYYGALAALAGLHERDATGRGVMIDLSQTEASTTLTSASLLDFQVNGRPSSGWGNVPYGSQDAPAGLYPCSGDDEWCAISVRADDQWARLTQILVDPRLDDPKFSTAAGRRAHRVHLDELLAERTKDFARDDLSRQLQDAAIPCTPMCTVVELLEDSALQRHGYFQAISHPELGTRNFQMGAIRSDVGPTLQRAAPLVGEANEYVYGEVLGLTPEQVAVLRDDAVI